MTKTPTDRRRSVLNDEEIQLLSEIVGCDLPVLHKMNDLQLLDYESCRRAIVWKIFLAYRLKKKELTRDQVVTMMRHRFGLDKKFIDLVITSKGMHMVPCCVQCGKPITKSMFRNNEGLCDECYAKNIELEL